MSGFKTILIVTVSLLSLILIWTRLSPDSRAVGPVRQQPPPAETAALNKTLLTRIESLESSLSSEQLMRQQLEQRISQLEQQRLDSTPDNQDISPADMEARPAESEQSSNTPETLQDRLLAASIPLDVVQRIQQTLGQNRLELLQLRNQAIREGWIDSAEYLEKMQQLQNPAERLREQFGDRVYDQYLYASSHPNRVIVNEVYSGSAADSAGIKPGDIILSYASESVFTMQDLQQATVEGNAGEAVLIELLRDDIPISTSATRGPLGISMTVTRKRPE